MLVAAHSSIAVAFFFAMFSLIALLQFSQFIPLKTKSSVRRSGQHNIPLLGGIVIISGLLASLISTGGQIPILFWLSGSILLIGIIDDFGKFQDSCRVDQLAS